MDNEPLRFARPAAAVARRAALPPGRFARPAHAPAALSAAPLLRERLRPTHRGLGDLPRPSGRRRRVFGLRAVPGHATVLRFARRRVEPGPLDAALAETVRRDLGGVGRAAQVAPDSTGCRDEPGAGSPIPAKKRRSAGSHRRHDAAAAGDGAAARRPRRGGRPRRLPPEMAGRGRHVRGEAPPRGGADRAARRGTARPGPAARRGPQRPAPRPARAPA